MAKQSWHNQPRDIETDKGMARTGAAKKLTPLRLHDSMVDRVTTSLGVPPTGAPPDASSPLPTDSVKQHGMKTFPIPACHPAMKSDNERGSYDPTRADKMIGEAILSGSTKLPEAVEEN